MPPVTNVPEEQSRFLEKTWLHLNFEDVFQPVFQKETSFTDIKSDGTVWWSWSANHTIKSLNTKASVKCSTKFKGKTNFLKNTHYILEIKMKFLIMKHNKELEKQGTVENGWLDDVFRFWHLSFIKCVFNVRTLTKALWWVGSFMANHFWLKWRPYVIIHSMISHDL